MKIRVDYKWVLLSICLCALVASATDQPQNEPSPTARDKFKMPKLFDFARFKELYKKSYKSVVEAAVREKLFLARAFRAFISGIRYKHGEKPYYLKVNKLSDWTPKEVAATHTHFHGMSDVRQQLKQFEPPTTTITTTTTPMPLLDPEDVLEELAEVQRHADEPEFREIVQELHLSPGGQTEARRRRDVVAKDKFSIDQLVAEAERAVESPEVAAKLQRIVPGNNPNREQPEMMSFGADSDDDDGGEFQITDPNYFSQISQAAESKRDRKHTGIRRVAHKILDLMHSGRSTTKDSNIALKKERKRKRLPDAVFVDLRDSGCFVEPRHQGHCGSCYAFAFASLLEYLYCMATGKLTEFSEQYMIDCGYRQHPTNEGCEGAASVNIGSFIVNFGIELRALYPYVKRRNQCPYPDSTDKSRMGYLKPNMQMFFIPSQTFEMEASVATTPIVLGIGTEGSDFFEYGGGVHDMNGCQVESADHAVLLIGHGREDNREYWLIRNSYGTSFGENGYYKLAKQSGCIFYDGIAFGQAYDPKRGVFEARMAPEENSENDPEIVAAFGRRITAPIYMRMWYMLTNT